MALVAGGDGGAGQAGEVQTKYKSTLAYPRESFVIVSWLILGLHWECHAWQHSALELRETSCPPSPHPASSGLSKLTKKPKANTYQNIVLVGLNTFRLISPAREIL